MYYPDGSVGMAVHTTLEMFEMFVLTPQKHRWPLQSQWACQCHPWVLRMTQVGCWRQFQKMGSNCLTHWIDCNPDQPAICCFVSEELLVHLPEVKTVDPPLEEPPALPESLIESQENTPESRTTATEPKKRPGRGRRAKNSKTSALTPLPESNKGPGNFALGYFCSDQSRAIRPYHCQRRCLYVGVKYKNVSHFDNFSLLFCTHQTPYPLHLLNRPLAQRFKSWDWLN